MLKVYSLLVALLFVFPGLVRAQTVFESYYRIEKDGRHAGYLIQKLHRDRKAGKMTLTVYARGLQDGKEVAQTWKAEVRASNASPLASEYTGTAPGMVPLVSARFGPKDFGQLQFSKAGQGRGPSQTIAKPSLLSTFVFLAADLAKLRIDKLYGYRAFAEDRGSSSLGTLRLVDEKTVSGTRILHVEDDFFGQKTENFLAESGEPLGSRNVAEKAVCRWVPDVKTAVGAFGFPKTEISNLFGGMPAGKSSTWAALSGFDSSSAIASFPKPVPMPGMNLNERRSSVASLPMRGL